MSMEIVRYTRIHKKSERPRCADASKGMDDITCLANLVHAQCCACRARATDKALAGISLVMVEPAPT